MAEATPAAAGESNNRAGKVGWRGHSRDGHSRTRSGLPEYADGAIRRFCRQSVGGYRSIRYSNPSVMASAWALDISCPKPSRAFTFAGMLAPLT